MAFWHGRIDRGHTVDFYKVWYATFNYRYRFCNTDYACRWIKDYKDPICGWGYDGKGPKQLALAMVYHAVSGRTINRLDPHMKAAKIALKYHELFARQKVAKFGDYWRITNRAIVFWVWKQRIKDFFRRQQ